MRRLALWLVGALTACGGPGGDAGAVWVERLPAGAPGAPTVDAHSTWIDVLELEIDPVDGEVPTVEPIEIRGAELEETGLEEMQRARRGEARVLSDLRAAFALAAPGVFEVRVPRGGRLRTALGVAPAPGAKAVHAGTVAEFTLAFDAGEGFRTLAHKTVSGDALHQWLDVEVAVGGAGRLRFEATLRAGTGDVLSRPRCAFAAPSLELERATAPDVILVSIDTLRADRLGCYGYARNTSPNLDRLAARGVVFERCISQAPWTLPSYGSLFTSLYPTEHRAGIAPKAEIWERGGSVADFAKGAERLIGDVPTLAEVLDEAGYRTSAVYFNPYLDPRAGLARGFDEYAGCLYGARAGVDRALEWLARNEGLPRFLFVQLIDPHWPYAPPAPYDRDFAGHAVEELPNYPWSLSGVRNRTVVGERRKLLSDLYDGEIAYVDAELGRLFAYLDARDSTRDALLVVHSDHGEELWDHGRLEHGHSMHDEVLHVPLIVARPSILSPGRVASSVRAIDVFPTMLDLLGLAAPGGLRGSSLVPLARGEAHDVQLEAFAESILWGRPYAPFDEAKAFVGDGFKVVVGDGNAPPQLYRLADDALELENLAASEEEELARMQAELEARFAGLRSGAGRAGGLELEPDALERLERIGYTGGEAAGAEK